MHRGLMASLVALAVASSCAEPSVAPPRGAPAQILASQTCREHFSRHAVPTYPRAAIHDHISGYAVAVYDLDGSGKAKNIRVVESMPPGIFDNSAIAALESSSFRGGVKAKECRYVADFAVVRRSAR